MPLFARVVPESDLIQIDREFDFRVPESFESQISYGQRVAFNLGRSKKALTGFVVGLSDASEFATSELLSIVSASQVLTPEIHSFCRKVADRQVVALGEILSHAIPEHMPKIELQETGNLLTEIPKLDLPHIRFTGEYSQRTALLASNRNSEAYGRLFPEWAIAALENAHSKLLSGESTLIVIPERGDVRLFIDLCKRAGLLDWVIDYSMTKKSDRFRNFYHALNSELKIVVGTRSTIYAPIMNLGLVILVDDLDDSLVDESSPFTNSRDLALIRAGDSIAVVIISNYRSVETQRLVELGYCSSVESATPPVRFAFSEPGQRIDAASFALLKEQLQNGPLLVLVPRKGHALGAFCSTCKERVRCKSCAGNIWQPTKHGFECRLCGLAAQSCHSCNSQKLVVGRAGSERTVAELGQAFPGAVISEVTADKPIGKIKDKNHIVVSTPGSIPAEVNSFAGVLILDSDIWLSRETLRSEELALRDWQEALNLLNPTGRAVAAGMPNDLGKVLSLGQHVAWAKRTLAELRALSLPPTTRIVSIEGNLEVVENAVSELLKMGVHTLRFNTSDTTAKALLKFHYNQGPEVSSALRQVSIRTAPRATKSGNRRGLRVVMDDLRAL